MTIQQSCQTFKLEQTINIFFMKNMTEDKVV